jgi:selenide,water dikinase
MALLPQEAHPDLIVGYDLADDAGVFRLNDETALIQTVDFFTPIVDDPYTFGQVAASNAMSDVYAMGGRPLTAMNILCFPTATLDRSFAAAILKGGLDKVHEAGAVLVGGHSVDDVELKYGLSVTGLVHPDRVIANSGAKPGQALVLTKPLGTGIIATAVKGAMASPEAEKAMILTMSALNKEAGEAAGRYGVTGGTDVTGFGLLGHGWEMAKASGVKLRIESARLPTLPGALEYAAMGLVPAGTWANQKYCTKYITAADTVAPEMLSLIADAQTSGGLLLAVPPDRAEDLVQYLASRGVKEAAIIGQTLDGPAGTIEVV